MLNVPLNSEMANKYLITLIFSYILYNTDLHFCQARDGLYPCSYERQSIMMGETLSGENYSLFFPYFHLMVVGTPRRKKNR